LISDRRIGKIGEQRRDIGIDRDGPLGPKLVLTETT